MIELQLPIQELFTIPITITPIENSYRGIAVLDEGVWKDLFVVDENPCTENNMISVAQGATYSA